MESDTDFQGLLTAAERDRLDRDGYVVLHDVVSPDAVQGMREEIDRLCREEWFTAPGVAPTPWQRLASQRPARRPHQARVMLARGFHLGLMWFAARILFRRWPGLKQALQERIHRPAAASGVVRRLLAEVIEAFYLAAVREDGSERICDLVNKSAEFDRCFTTPRVMAAVDHILGGDFKVSSLNFRGALPGGGSQPLHSDWHVAAAPSRFFACNTLWVLDDFTPRNGATRIVPGSHLWEALPPVELHDAHPNQVSVLARAGSVIVLNSHVWHSGTRNRTAATRRVLQCFFVRRECRPQLDQQSFVRRDTRLRLSAEARAVLGVT